MICQRLKLANFRNWREADVELRPGVNILLGDNGSGKTNLLEGLYFLAHLEGFRADRDSALITRGAKSLHAEGLFISDTGAQHGVDVHFSAGKKFLRVNDAPVLRIADYWGRIPVYLFSPASMELLWGQPERRRDLWDGEIAKFSGQFRTDLSNYKTAWLSRNRTLKIMQEGRGDSEARALLKFYTDSLALTGSRIVFERMKFLREVLSSLDEFYHQLTAEKFRLRVHYASSIGRFEGEVGAAEVREAYVKRLAEMAQKERERGYTLVGPHRDDVRFYLGDIAIGDFASQGQARAATIALMLTLAKIYERNMHEKPLLLLDDVLSELDDTRKSNLLAIASSFPQTLLTSASKREIRGLLPMKPRIFSVGGGNITPVVVKEQA